MIRIREFVLALALCVATPATAEPATTASMAAQVLGQLGFDQAFERFGASIAAGPRQSGMADESFLARWEQVIPATFGRAGLVGELDGDVARTLDLDELSVVAGYAGSELGQRILALEANASKAEGSSQIETIARGQALLLEMSPARRAMLGELIELSGARTTVAMLRESLRAIALGLRLGRRGGIAASYDEVEAEIGNQLAPLEDSLTSAIEGALAAAYAGLADEELRDYLEVLRRPAMLKFQKAVTTSTCRIIRRTMLEALQELVPNSRSVSI